MPIFCSVLFKPIKVTFPCRGCTCYRIFHHVFTCRYGPIAPRTGWHIPGTKLAVFGSLLTYILVLITQIIFSYPNPYFLLTHSIVFGIRTWSSFQFKKATLTQNCRLKRYSKEENKDSATKKEQIQYFQAGHISNFRFPPNLIISPCIWYFSRWKKINLETNQPCCLQWESTKFVCLNEEERWAWRWKMQRALFVLLSLLKPCFFGSW